MIRIAAAAVVLAAAGCAGTAQTRATPTPASAASLVNQGLKAHKDGDLDAARRLYERALKKDARNKFAWFDLGVLDHDVNPQSAERHYRRALSIDPAFPQALYNLALLRISVAPREAAEMLEKTVAAQPANATAHYHLGRAYKALGRKDQANAAFAKAHELNPQIPLEKA